MKLGDTVFFKKREHEIDPAIVLTVYEDGETVDLTRFSVRIPNRTELVTKVKPGDGVGQYSTDAPRPRRTKATSAGTAAGA